MLFKFKSQAASDLIMLDADARKLLKIILSEDRSKGIVQWDDLPRAITALERAVAQDEAHRKQVADTPQSQGAVEEEAQTLLSQVSLAQRAAPMLKLFKRCLSEKSDVVWGV